MFTVVIVHSILIAVSCVLLAFLSYRSLNLSKSMNKAFDDIFILTSRLNIHREELDDAKKEREKNRTAISLILGQMAETGFKPVSRKSVRLGLSKHSEYGAEGDDDLLEDLMEYLLEIGWLMAEDDDDEYQEYLEEERERIAAEAKVNAEAAEAIGDAIERFEERNEENLTDTGPDVPSGEYTYTPVSSSFQSEGHTPSDPYRDPEPTSSEISINTGGSSDNYSSESSPSYSSSSYDSGGSSYDSGGSSSDSGGGWDD